MAILIIHPDRQGTVSCVVSQIEIWLSARGTDHRILAANAPELASAVVGAAAVIGLADGTNALAMGLRNLPDGALAGKASLFIEIPIQPAIYGNEPFSIWSHQERLGTEIQIKPVKLSEWSDLATELSSEEIFRLENGMLALVEGIAFCRRLQKAQESLVLAQYFTHAPILA